MIETNEPRRRRGRRFERGASSPAIGELLWLGVLLVGLTWSPFRAPPSPIVELALEANPLDLAGNLLLLIPLAALLAVRDEARLVLDTLLVAAIAVALEVGQLHIAGRVVSPYDPLLNVGGAFAAMLLIRALLSRGMSAAWLRAATIGLVYALVAGYLLLAAVGARDGVELLPWDATYGVRAGDEFVDPRRYLGTVSDARLCALDGTAILCLEPNADHERRQRVTRIVERGRRFELHATVRSASDAHDGPTRILTFSRDGFSRNATLAQQGRALVLRVRIRRAGPNGEKLEFHLPDAVHAGELTDVRAGYDRGVVYLESTSPTRRRAARFHVGLLGGWQLTSFPAMVDRVEPRSFELGRVLGALAIFLPLGIAIGAWIERRTSTHARSLRLFGGVAASALAAAAALVALTAAATPPDGRALAYVVAAAAVGSLVARSGPRRRAALRSAAEASTGRYPGRAPGDAA